MHRITCVIHIFLTSNKTRILNNNKWNLHIVISDIGCSLILGNIAYRKSADQGYNRYSEIFIASYAVDGNTDPRLKHNHCALAEYLGPYSYSWVVDLGELHEIEKVTLIGTLGE